VQHRQPMSSAAVSPLSVTRAHRLVDAPALSGFTVWLTGSASFSIIEGPSPSSSRTTRLRPMHGAALQVEAPSAQAHDGGSLGIYPLKTMERVNGGSTSTPAPALCNDWSSLIGVQNSSRITTMTDLVDGSGVSTSNPRFRFYSHSI
jgi:hypothetical protein